MKLVLLLLLFLFLLSSFLSGKDITSQAPRSSLTPNVDGEEDEKQLNVFLQESQRIESVREVTPSFELLVANTVKNEMILSSACCRHMISSSTSKQEDTSQGSTGYLGGRSPRAPLPQEFGFPWLQVYLPIKSCHVILKNETGVFSPPILNRSQTNNWCNWTIWAGPHKHILIYIEGFEGKSNCEENQDKIIFQGVLSSVESKVAYACRNHGTLIFATQAVAVHVVFLSKSPSQNHSHKYFKGWYYIFEEHEMKEPVSKSNSSAGFFHKSYIVHSAHVLDFVKTSRTPSNETWSPLTTKKSWKINDRAETMDALQRPAVGNNTQLSFLKSAENVTLNPLTMKRMQVANPTVHETRPGNESSSGNLRDNLDLRSNRLENEEKQFTYNQTLSSTSPHVSQKLKMMTKLVELNDHETSTKATSLQDGSHVTTHLMATYSENAVEATFGKVTFKNRITLPQVLVEEPTILSPKSIVEKRHSQSFQSNSGFSRKNIDVVKSQQHMKPKEALTKDQIVSEAYRQENSNSKRYMAVPLVRNNESQLITETPKSSTNKRKYQVTTIDHPNVLHDLSLRALKHNFMDVATTVNPQIVYSHDPKNVKTEITVSPHLSNSVTRYRKRPQRKYTRPNPPYSSSGSASRSNTSLKVENDSYESVSRSHENNSVLLSQHNPGDLLFEITFGIDKGQTALTRSGQDKALIEFVKRQVQRKLKPFSNKVKEIKLKEILRGESEIDRQTDAELMVVFWLHLTPKRKDVAHLVHSQLENLNGTSVEAGKIQRVLVRDVNECDAGMALCGDEATCLNGYGTYLCKCKEDYEDGSQTKSGTMCIRTPRSGLDSLYSYAEILVGTTVFFISALVVVISVLCTIVKKRRTKKDLHFQEAVSPGTPDASSESQQTTFDQNNIHHLLTLDPAQLKLRAKVPERPLHARNGPSEAYRVSIEQSEYL